MDIDLRLWCRNSVMDLVGIFSKRWTLGIDCMCCWKMRWCHVSLSTRVLWWLFDLGWFGSPLWISASSPCEKRSPEAWPINCNHFFLKSSSLIDTCRVFPSKNFRKWTYYNHFLLSSLNFNLFLFNYPTLIFFHQEITHKNSVKKTELAIKIGWVGLTSLKNPIKKAEELATRIGWVGFPVASSVFFTRFLWVTSW